jgi:hypothetical protein
MEGDERFYLFLNKDEDPCYLAILLVFTINIIGLDVLVDHRLTFLISI